MTSPDEFDPDDNFSQAFEADPDLDEDAAREALVWQLLLMLNPGDEDAARQQFERVQETLSASGDEADLVTEVRAVIDWKSGFDVGEDEAGALVDCLDELAARWNLRIDWDLDDDTEPDDVVAVLGTAHDRLREHHYTLWTYETGDHRHAGWITREADAEGLRLLAGALGFHVREGTG